MQASKPDLTAEPGRPPRTPRVQLDSDHPASPAARQEAGRAAQPGAEVEDARMGRDARPPRQDVHGGQTAVVVLVERKEVVGSERAFRAALQPAGGGEHLPLVDGMVVVVVEDAHGRSPCLEAGRLP